MPRQLCSGAKLEESLHFVCLDILAGQRVQVLLELSKLVLMSRVQGIVIDKGATGHPVKPGRPCVMRGGTHGADQSEIVARGQ